MDKWERRGISGEKEEGEMEKKEQEDQWRMRGINAEEAEGGEIGKGRRGIEVEGNGEGKGRKGKRKERKGKEKEKEKWRGVERGVITLAMKQGNML